LLISAPEFVRKFSPVCDAALARPLIITRHGRERTVVMSLAMYRELTNPRRSRSALPERAAPLASAKPGSRKQSTQPKLPPNALSLRGEVNVD
jgi:prevent-host-death family protein